MCTRGLRERTDGFSGSNELVRAAAIGGGCPYAQACADVHCQPYLWPDHSDADPGIPVACRPQSRSTGIDSGSVHLWLLALPGAGEAVSESLHAARDGLGAEPDIL